jgi:dTDP-4-amino-4,6-dideoxygalactose transaminase
MDRHSYRVSDRCRGECLSLLLFVGMTDAQIDAAIHHVRNFMSRG